MILAHNKNLLIIFALSLSIGTANAQNPHSQTEVALLLRQIEQLHVQVDAAMNKDVESHSRYYFDYQRLNKDLNVIRTGIYQYLNPKRAQPRDMQEISGEYIKPGGHEQ